MNSKEKCEHLAKTWEFMPGSKPPYRVFIPKDKHIIFFAGTFNPWHKGHLACIKALNKNSNLFIIPDHNPEKKLINKNSPWESYEKLKNKIPYDIPIYPGFWAQNKKNPTSLWIQKIKECFPEVKISLLMGFDSFISIHKWIEADKLLKSLHGIYMVSRKDKDSEKAKQTFFLTQKFPDLKITFLGHHDFEHLSSTQIRKKEHIALE